MKKLLITSILFAAAAAQAGDNWTNAAGDPWKNSTGLCWRDANWTPATAHRDCDGAIKPASPVATVTPAQKVDITQPTATLAARVAPVIPKASYAADAFFDFDKSTLKPEGKASLDRLAILISTINLEVTVIVGHTDSVGSDAYNMKLGQRRADAVKAYLVAKGIPANRVYTESKGERQPVADNRTRDGRARNRRVEIEVVGTSK